MNKPKVSNPDFAAMALMAFTLLTEVAVRIAADESLLALLPPWLGPIVLLLAAAARYGFGKGGDEPTEPPAAPADATPEHIPDEVTEPIEVDW